MNDVTLSAVLRQFQTLDMEAMRLAVLLGDLYPGGMTPHEMDPAVARALRDWAFATLNYCARLAGDFEWLTPMVEGVIGELGCLYGLDED
jgi:hypothetical protein